MDLLETPRLVIRPFTMDDLEEAYRLLDMDIQWAGPGRTLEWRRERLKLYVGLANWEDTGCLYGYRALVLKHTGQMIGICGFHPDYWPPDWIWTFWPQLLPDWAVSPTGSFELGIGWALSQDHRGRGYATEAARQMLKYSFSVLRVSRVFAITDHDNQASVNVMRRLGMRIAYHPDPYAVYPAVAGVIENEHA